MSAPPERGRLQARFTRVKRRIKPVLGRFTPRFTDHADWSIGILQGPSPFELSDVPGLPNPVLDRATLSDRRIAFAADPFGFQLEGTWYLFYEVMDLRTGRGRIDVSVSADLRHWEHLGPVLQEPFHLSYPHVFRHDDGLYMVPEAWESGAVRLYRAEAFPIRWTHVADLLAGPVLLDPTLFRTDHGWWMFVDTSPTLTAGELRLFHAAQLPGPWTEHPSSPVVREDQRISRPAGRVVEWDGALVRFTQDCTRFYGAAVHAVRIDRLDPEHYAETELDGPVLAGSGAGWNASAMHQLDLHPDGHGGWLAFVDGHSSR